VSYDSDTVDYFLAGQTFSFAGEQSNIMSHCGYSTENFMEMHFSAASKRILNVLPINC
jgi:hypothetical protein